MVHWSIQLIAVLALATIFISVAFMLILLGPIANSMVSREADGIKDVKVLADIRVAARDTLLKAASGVALLLGAVGTVGALVYAAQTALASLEAAQAAQTEANVAQDTRVTDSYATAIDQLASNTADERLGGIYELERVMRDSPRDQPAVVNVLADFVREHSRSSNPTVDILAALKVISRRDPVRDSNPLDLDGAHLDNAELPSAHFHGANLSGAFMGGVQLLGADLSMADLGSADISGADLNGATLQDANLDGGAILSGATLEEANLQGADLRGADLTGADLRGANLTGADLRGADLHDALGLTSEQLSRVRLDSKTKLPSGL